ncbi:hypothetical protein BDZ91DRAFT_764211 [Kalaharituber pfeilii]|nr:hypothetical protein BDZ91DRAFT_764211 [Kalaharituber pfeilii]
MYTLAQLFPNDMDLKDILMTEEFVKASLIPGVDYDFFKINHMLAATFGANFRLHWQDQWLGVLKFISKPTHAIICANPPAHLPRIPVEEVNDPWPEIESTHDCTLFGILADYAIYQYWQQQGVKGAAGVRAWMAYYPQEIRKRDAIREAARCGELWSMIADKVGAGFLYAIACSTVIACWDGRSSEALSDHELHLILAWIAENPKLQNFCSDLTALMAKMLRGQKPEHRPFE